MMYYLSNLGSYDLHESRGPYTTVEAALDALAEFFNSGGKYQEHTYSRITIEGDRPGPIKVRALKNGAPVVASFSLRATTVDPRAGFTWFTETTDSERIVGRLALPARLANETLKSMTDTEFADLFGSLREPGFFYVAVPDPDEDNASVVLTSLTP